MSDSSWVGKHEAQEPLFISETPHQPAHYIEDTSSAYGRIGRLAGDEDGVIGDKRGCEAIKICLHSI